MRRIEPLWYRPQMNGFRPPSYVPTAYQLCNNPAVCSSFVLYPTLAVGILTSFTHGL